METSLKPRTRALISKAREHRVHPTKIRKGIANVYRKARKALGNKTHRYNLTKRLVP